VVPMPEVNSSPRKLTAPPGLFETVSKEIQQQIDTPKNGAAALWKATAAPRGGYFNSLLDFDVIASILIVWRICRLSGNEAFS
ncbi:hypothetical protein, partial [Burkholderia sp. BDU5]|uniref:hypothetical protein n=1 Tax=Burkholderia sp. BDU5 TaxID=1385590 RepID=UPI001E5D017B